MATDDAAAGSPLTFDCKNCSASLTFAAGTERLECEYCGTVQEIEAAPVPEGAIREYDLSSGLDAVRRQPASTLVERGTELRCEACGARTVLEGTAGSCVYCDTPLVAVQGDDGDVIVPESVLPFKIDQDDARRRFRRWATDLWFAPSDLGKRAAADGIDGVYMPYWTFDAQSSSDYRGERGEHYWVDESFTTPQGGRSTRKVRKTRWHSTSGNVDVPFDDVLVCGNAALPKDLIQSLEPWDLADLRPYDPAYLSGFVAERYAVDLPQAFELAQGRMRQTITQAAQKDIGGDAQRVHALDTDLSQVKFKLTLLPLWLSSFRYEGKVYRFMINARTGEVSGKRPWSAGKIALAVLLAVMLCFCLIVGTGGLALPIVIVVAPIAGIYFYKQVTANS